MEKGAFKEEREELSAVLRSGIFARSPSLGQFLQYICDKYFEGRADEIKEYSVAVEALGRSADFDQKKDSIVRVEAHRLRKRLREYYRGEGVSSRLRITIPSGNYVPVFERVESGSPIPSTDDTVEWELLNDSALPPAPAFVAPAVAPVQKKFAWLRFSAVTGAVVALALVVAGYVFFRNAEARESRPEMVRTVSDQQMEVRILCGNTEQQYVDEFGAVWRGDRFFTGGTAVKAPQRNILRTRDQSVYLHRREGEFRYDIPLKPGTYELRLHHAETVYGDGNDGGGGESTRVFRVRANGAVLWDPVDIIAEAGGSNTANVRVFKDLEPAPDGLLHLAFAPVKDIAFVNAIEILPTASGHMRPARILPRAKSWTDHRSVEWSGDEYFYGGQMATRHDSVLGAPEQELFRNERFGNFSYVIPVAVNTQYTVTLRFAEHWFGPGRNGGGGEGSRVFDVYCNGKALLRNFDVYHESGGSLRPLERTFRGIEPTAQGKLRLEFVPVRNYAMVNAIEVIDEGKH